MGIQPDLDAINNIYGFVKFKLLLLSVIISYRPKEDYYDLDSMLF
jgi:hypothetical protein